MVLVILRENLQCVDVTLARVWKMLLNCFDVSQSLVRFPSCYGATSPASQSPVKTKRGRGRGRGRRGRGGGEGGEGGRRRRERRRGRERKIIRGRGRGREKGEPEEEEEEEEEEENSPVPRVPRTPQIQPRSAPLSQIGFQISKSKNAGCAQQQQKVSRIIQALHVRSDKKEGGGVLW